MKSQNATIVIIAAILTQVAGAVLNYVVVSANGGMPVAGYTEAFAKWVPLTQETKFPYLADTIRAGSFAFSIGDCLLVIGNFVLMVLVWFIIPQGRKFIPFLIVSLVGVIWSQSLPDSMVSTSLFMLVSVGALSVIYWKYRCATRTKTSDNKV